jgi:hypothetical protein
VQLLFPTLSDGSVSGLTIQSGSGGNFTGGGSGSGFVGGSFRCESAVCALTSVGVVCESAVEDTTRNNMMKAAPTLGIIFSSFAIFSFFYRM